MSHHFTFCFAFVSCYEEIDNLAFQEFQNFIKKYHKKYESINDYLERFEVFKRNLISILSEKDKLSYKIGITKFSDLTRKEFKKIYSNDKPMNLANFDAYIPNKEPKDYPESFDWRDRGVDVPSDRNQGPCGDGWAFITQTNLGCLYYLNKNQWKTFSMLIHFSNKMEELIMKKIILMKECRVNAEKILQNILI